MLEFNTNKNITELKGKKLAGGEKTRKIFEDLLKINYLNKDKQIFKITAILWNTNCIEIEISNNTNKKFNFIIEDLKDKNNYFLKTDNLSIYYQGDKIPKELENLLRKNSISDLAKYSLKDLGYIFLNDPALGNPEEKTPGIDLKGEELFKSKALLSSWGSKDVWYNFFAAAEIARSQLDSLNFFDKCIFIQHCDQECVTVSPNLGVPLIETVFYPWDDKIRNNNQPFKKEQTQKFNYNNEKNEVSMYMTDLKEQDVILGTSIKKLTDVLEDVSKKKLNNFIMCSCTCVPIVSGEPTESIVKKYQKISKSPILFLTCTANSMENIFHNLLVKERIKAQEKILSITQNNINLIGFPNNASIKELSSILNKLSININTIILPHLEIKTIKKFPDAKLNVFHSNNLWNHLYNQLSFNSNIKSIYPINPYGLKNTNTWVKSIINNLNLNIEIEAVLNEEYNKIKKEWLILLEEAKKYSICFVIDSKETFRLTEFGHSWGVPLISVIEEMGFNIVIYIYALDKNSAYKSAKEVNNLFLYPEKHTIKAFNTQERLNNLLNLDNIDAIYSDYSFDWRITDAGKSQFYLQIFEMGINGALKSLQRLLEICKLPFFKKYNKYLKKRHILNKNQTFL